MKVEKWTVNFQLSTFNFQLSPFNSPLSTFNSNSPTFKSPEMIRFNHWLNKPALFPLLYILTSCQAQVPPEKTDGNTRDPLKHPFASNSIWNMPIGSAARYVNAGLAGEYPDEWASMPYADQDVIINAPTAPMTEIKESRWSGNRCEIISTKVFAQAPVPRDFLLPSNNHNMAAGILMPDGRTIVNVQPLTRCEAGGPATAIVRYPDSDLYGDGIAGARGGSGMSSIGGALRAGELRPGQKGPQHALKLTLFMGEAHKPAVRADAHRWPATKSDSYAMTRYGAWKPGPEALKMGALLAIPPSVDITALGLETEPAKQLAWTLQNYGGYVADDAYGMQFGISTEVGPGTSFTSQFQADYGFTFNQRQNATGAGSAWMRDIQRLLRALQVVDNNGPGSIGGGGPPLQPLAPELEP